MHAVKVGWVGQTFALAKCNESGGRKSRIRRSKQERKAMVESFIKKYQKSNHGNFPSLNLTHKEVGGSFYTIREIVREIIQENRVLGPAKLTSGEQNDIQFLEQYPLGSISVEPQTSFPVPSNGSPLVSNCDEGTTVEPSLSFDSRSSGFENWMSENGRIVNGSHIVVKNEASDKLCTEIEDSTPFGAEEGNKELAASKTHVTPVAADVVVETFPIRPLTEPIDFNNGKSLEVRDMTVTLEGKEINEADLGPGNDSSLNSSSMCLKSVENPADPFIESKSSVVDEKAEENLAGPLSERKSELVDAKAVQDHAGQLSETKCGLEDEEAVDSFGDPPLGSERWSTIHKETVQNTEVNMAANVNLSHDEVLASETSEHSQTNIATEVINSPNGICTNGDIQVGEPKTQEPSLVENNTDDQQSGSPKKETNPTLNRINLESWEGMSKTSADSGTNPLWTIFKSFVSAFVKFWSE